MKNANNNFRGLTASKKAAPEGKKGKELAANKIVTPSIMLPSRASQDEINRVIAEVESGKRRPLTPKEREKLLGAHPHHVAAVTRAAKSHGMQPLKRSQADRTHGIVRYKGTYAAAKKFFAGLQLHVYTDAKSGKAHIGRQGVINVPANLPILGVFGLDDREVARSYARTLPLEHAAASSFPHLTARGQAKLQGVPVDEYTHRTDIVGGYISLGGNNGRVIRTCLKQAAADEGIPVARFVGVSVNGASVDAPSDDSDVENLLDALAHALLYPSGTLYCFRAPNDDDSFATAGETAVTYTIKIGDESVSLGGFSISWGQAESGNTEQSLQRWERIMQSARLGGVPIRTAATGDDGSTDRTDSDTPDAPSVVPGIIGAAGFGYKAKQVDGKWTLTERHVWNNLDAGGGATGGGISAVFAALREEEQFGFVSSSGKPGHSASLIADSAEPQSGPVVYIIRNGRVVKTIVGGTSNAAPFSCAKLLLIQSDLKKKIGDVIGFIYKHAAEGICFGVTVDGSNGAYTAKVGDLCTIPTGFGEINFPKFREVALREQDGVTSIAGRKPVRKAGRKVA